MSKEKKPNPPSSGSGGSPAACTTGTCPAASEHFIQQKSNSCVIASSRNMIYDLTGENVPEETLQSEMKEILNEPNHDFETTGINPSNAEALLKKHGVDTTSQYNVNSDKLPDLVKDGQPALIGFKNPGHRVMLDSVSIDKDGNRTYNVIDPDPAYNGTTRKMSQADFDAKYNSKAIVIVGKSAKK
jgi:hypothetical protein